MIRGWEGLNDCRPGPYQENDQQMKTKDSKRHYTKDK